MPIILKLQSHDEIYRVRLEQRSVQLEDLNMAIQKFLPGLSTRDFKYVDTEGDLCTLCEATLPDFLAEAESGRTAMKLVFTPVAHSVTPGLANPPPEGQRDLDAPAVAEVPVADPLAQEVDSILVAGQRDLDALPPELDAQVVDSIPVVPPSPIAELARALEAATGADEPSMAGQQEGSHKQRRERHRDPLRPVHNFLGKVFGRAHGRGVPTAPVGASRVLHLRGPHSAKPRSCAHMHSSTQGLAVCEIAAILRQDLGLEGSVHDVIRQASALLGVQNPISGGLRMQAYLCYQQVYGEGSLAPLQGPRPSPAAASPEAKHSVRSVDGDASGEGSKCKGKGRGKCKGRSTDKLSAKDSSLTPACPGTESVCGSALASDAGVFQSDEKACDDSIPPCGQAGTEIRGDLPWTGEEFLIDMGLCESAEEAREALRWYGGDVLATVEGLTSSDSSE